uniref:Uncharacterized protein n=1 Tax=Globodera rostochiensis TaxID=31243 RepID=A0A914H5Y5_GLORO
MKAIQDPIVSPSKKAKLTPIKTLRPGESMIDIKLTLIVSDAIRTVGEKSNVLTMIGSDGYDFINITCWDRNVERISRELGPSFLNKTFYFKTFGVRNIGAQYNYGSVEYEIRCQEGSTCWRGTVILGVPSYRLTH